MKWLVVAMALFGGVAQANEKVEFGIQSKGHNHCAWFKDSFTEDGYLRPKNDSRPVVACQLVNNVGATCYLSNTGIAGLPSTLKMVGAFVMNDREIVTEVDSGVIRMRVFCQLGLGCHKINVWDVNDAVGFSCDMEKFVAPKKPAPLPPPLLRKPDSSNTPVAPAKSSPDFNL